MGTSRFRQRISLTGALLTATILGGSLASRPAHAAMGCMTDPFVVLSNGVVTHLYAVLPDNNVGDVRSVTYNLVIPAGTTVVQQVATDGLMGAKEHFQYSATNRAGKYNTTTVVQTATMGGRVTATTSIGTASSSTSGKVNQALHIHLDQNSQGNQNGQ
jgi:hypothetical protein